MKDYKTFFKEKVEFNRHSKRFPHQSIDFAIGKLWW